MAQAVTSRDSTRIQKCCRLGM